jgi:hypothetical protein
MTPFDTLLTRISAQELPLDFNVGEPYAAYALWARGLDPNYLHPSTVMDIGAPCDCYACSVRANHGPMPELIAPNEHFY